MKHRGTVLSLIGLALTFAVTAASAQTYTVLHTYPVGSGAYCRASVSENSPFFTRGDSPSVNFATASSP